MISRFSYLELQAVGGQAERVSVSRICSNNCGPRASSARETFTLTVAGARAESAASQATMALQASVCTIGRGRRSTAILPRSG